MKILKVVALIITTAILLTSCKTCPKAPVRTLDESDLDQWPKECTKDGDTWTCPAKTLSWVYTTMGDLYFDSVQLLSDQKFSQKKYDLIIEGKDAQLDQWWRKWYFTIPLGIIIGGASAATYFLVRDINDYYDERVGPSFLHAVGVR